MKKSIAYTEVKTTEEADRTALEVDEAVKESVPPRECMGGLEEIRNNNR